MAFVQIRSSFSKLTSSALHYLLSFSSKYATEIVAPKDANYATLSWTCMRKNAHSIVFNLYTTLLILRLLFCSLTLNLNNKDLSVFFSTYDPLLSLFVRAGLIDRYLALVFIPPPMLMLYMDYQVYFSRGLRVFDLIYYLLVLNREDFWSINPQISSWQTFRDTLWQYESARCSGVKLSYSGAEGAQRLGHHVDHALRCRAVLLTTLSDFLNAFLLILFTIIILSVVTYYQVFVIWPLMGSSTPATATFLLFDFSLIAYMFGHIIKVAIFFESSTNLLIYIFICQQRLANRRLNKLLVDTASAATQVAPLEAGLEHTESGAVCGQKLAAHRFKQRQLALYLGQDYLHAQLNYLKDIVRANSEILSRAFFFFFLSLFGAHVYSLSALTLKKNMSMSEQIILFLMFLILTILMAIYLVPFAKLHSTLHSPAGLLYRAIKALSGSPYYATLQLQLAVYFEVLTSGKKFGVSVGGLVTVTPSFVFEYISLFFVYFFFALNLTLDIIKNN